MGTPSSAYLSPTHMSCRRRPGHPFRKLAGGKSGFLLLHLARACSVFQSSTFSEEPEYLSCRLRHGTLSCAQREESIYDAIEATTYRNKASSPMAARCFHFIRYTFQPSLTQQPATFCTNLPLCEDAPAPVQPHVSAKPSRHTLESCSSATSCTAIQ